MKVTPGFLRLTLSLLLQQKSRGCVGAFGAINRRRDRFAWEGQIGHSDVDALSAGRQAERDEGERCCEDGFHCVSPD